MECILSHLQQVEIDTYMIDIAFWVTVVVRAQILVLVLSRNYISSSFSSSCYIAHSIIEMMLLREMRPQLKLPINVMKGSMPLQCNTYFPKILAI